jgi:hypothetical protein
LRFRAIPDPDARMEIFGLQFAFFAVPQGQTLPGLRGLLGGPAVDPKRRALGFAPFRRSFKPSASST